MRQNGGTCDCCTVREDNDHPGDVSYTRVGEARTVVPDCPLPWIHDDFHLVDRSADTGPIA